MRLAQPGMHRPEGQDWARATNGAANGAAIVLT